MKFLVATESLKVLDVGFVEVSETGEFLGFRRRNVTPEVLERAVIRFVATYGGEGVRLIDENEFWNLNLSLHERVDKDFGIDFRGTRHFVERNDQTS